MINVGTKQGYLKTFEGSRPTPAWTLSKLSDNSFYENILLCDKGKKHIKYILFVRSRHLHDHSFKDIFIVGFCAMGATFPLAPAPIVQCSAVEWNTVQCCAVKHSAVQCSAVKHTVQCDASARSSSQVSQHLLSRHWVVEGDIQCEPWDPQYA